KVPERPMIEERLKDGKIADVLVAEGSLKLFYLLGHKTQTAMHVHDLLGKLPVNRFDFRFGFEIEKTEVEHLLRFFLDVLAVMQALDAVASLEPLFHVENVTYQSVVFLSGFDFEFRRGPFDGTESFHHEHGMMRDNSAPTFTHNGGMRHALGIADVHDVPNDVIGVFLERIIRGTVEITSRSIVINPETAADIQITELVSEFTKLAVVTRRFAHRAFDRRDVWHLRSHVEMNEFEAVSQPSLFQSLTGGHKAGCIQAEFCVLTAAGRPFARALAVQTDTN